MTIRRIGAAFGTIVAFALTAPAQAETESIVVSVGVNHSFDQRLPTLSFAETDAERFHYAMTTVGNVPPASATLLRSPSAEEFVNTVRVMARSRAKDRRTPGDHLRLILYFSGHADDRGLHFRGGPLSRARLHELIAETDAETRVVVLDSCFSGSIAAKGVEAAPAFNVPKLDVDELTGTVFLTATAAREAAFESEELSGSVFTHHLLAGLNGGADANTDGLVTVDELYQYVYRETRLRSGTYPTASVQRPEYHAELHGQGAIVLSRPRRGSGELRVDPGIMGEVYLSSTGGLGSFTVYGQARGFKVFQIPEGAYRAVIRRGDRIGEASVIIVRGESADLRPSQFGWHEIDVQLADLSKGASVMTGATVMDMYAVRQAFGVDVHTFEGERSVQIMSMVSQRSKLSVLLQGRAYHTQGEFDERGFVAAGTGLGLGIMTARSSDSMRVMGGFGMDYEWQWWKRHDADDGQAWEARRGERTEISEKEHFNRGFTPNVYLGAVLPITNDREGRWSLSLRRVFDWQELYDAPYRIVPQYLVGLVIE